MKKIILICAMLGCSNDGPMIITYKSIYKSNGMDTHTDLLPSGFCTFGYWGRGHHDIFIDSCKYYQIGDTLGIKK